MCVCACVCVCACACVCVCVCVCMCMCVRLYTYVHSRVSVYVCVSDCVHCCMPLMCTCVYPIHKYPSTLPILKVMDHLVLIKNANQTGVYKYLSKAISKKRESGELVVEVATVKPGDVPQPKKIPQMVFVPIPGHLATRLADAVEKITNKQGKRQVRTICVYVAM